MEKRYIQTFETGESLQEALDNNELGKPYVAYLEDEQRIDWNEKEKAPDYSLLPLTFEIISGGTITINLASNRKDSFEYQLNNGEWTQPTNDSTSFTVAANDRIRFRGNNSNYADSGKDITPATVTCDSSTRFNICGNIMSLIDSVNYTSLSTIQANYTFNAFFKGCSGLTNAEDLVLPATGISGSCYRAMFRDCKNLITAPKLLPATGVGDASYKSMFEGCSNLTTTPIILGTSWINISAEGMFYGCSSLTEIPSINIVSVDGSAFHLAFAGIPNLTTVDNITFPETLAQGTNQYFGQIFYNDSNLSYVKCLVKNPDDTRFRNWLQGVSPTGTFVKHPDATWPSGESGIPNGWTVQDATI